MCRLLKFCSIFLFGCILMSYSYTRVLQSEGKILWGEKQLIWSDFKGKPDLNSSDAAHIVYSIKIFVKKLSSDSVAVGVESYFYTNESWTRTSSDTALKHEIGHFDLVEIYSREIRKKITEATFTYSNLSNEIDNIFKPLRKQCDNTQDKYDNETNHSKNYLKQIHWEKFIKLRLDSLSEYSTCLTPIKINWKK
jgi:hypothetical protein